MNLESAIRSTKCRKGPAVGTTKNGAYWLACDPILIRRHGGDGIGCQAANCTMKLEFRHYRSGDVTPVIKDSRWHQNTGEKEECQRVGKLLLCETAEEVVVILKGTRMGSDEDYIGDAVFSDFYHDELIAAMVVLGMPACLPSPDEEISTEGSAGAQVT